MVCPMPTMCYKQTNKAYASKINGWYNFQHFDGSADPGPVVDH